MFSTCLVAAVGAALGFGCQQSEQVPQPVGSGATGSIQLALTAQSAAGITYRLRDATFELDGPSYVSVDTREESDDDAIELQLPVGDYDAHLADGWRLVRIEGDGSESGVSAQLTSANPQTFTISEGLISPVVFRFQVNNGDVDFGGAEIDIEVDDGVTCVPAPETCNGADDDCDEVIDENTGSSYFADQDGDGFGNASETIQACAPLAGFVANNADCNDANASANPSAIETCDAVDNNCDGLIDEGVTSTYFRDSDRDGFGAASMSISACTQPSGYVTSANDCSDLSSNMRPGQTNYYTIGIGQSFDYNCDGVQTPRDTNTQQCNGWSCSPGWIGGAPGCGQSGTFGLCQGFLGSCGGTQTRTQACR